MVSWDYDAGAYGPTIFVLLRTLEDVKLLSSTFSELAESNGVRIDVERAGTQLINISRFELISDDMPVKKRLKRVDDGPGFEWRCTQDQWGIAAALLEPFLAGSTGHQYLTQENVDDALVEVSYGEEHVGRAEHQNRRG
jgi:hypothetical protein